MTGELMRTMYHVDDDAYEQVEAITQKLLRRNPMPKTDDILERTWHFNTQRCIAEELVVHEMVLVVREVLFHFQRMLLEFYGTRANRQ